MNRKDIFFPHDYVDSFYKDGFLRACMDNSFNTKQSIVDSCAAAADDVEEFIDLYIEHEEEAGTQFYAELVKRERPNKLFYAIRHIFGERQFKTMSDAGSLRIANSTFALLIPNGYGDGVTRAAVFEDRDSFSGDNLLSFFTIFETPQAFVYDYDCGGVPVAELSGRYAAYYGEGFVALVKLDNRT